MTMAIADSGLGPVMNTDRSEQWKIKAPLQGLPEELEKMVKRAPVNRRIVMRDHTHEVLNWARKRICKWCADGSTPVWDERNKAVVHLSSYMRFDGNWWAVCAASVLREGLR